MGIKVAKFGGSSLADAKAFKKVADIILSDPDRRYVVASAPGKRFDKDIKVTDLLYACYNAKKENGDVAGVLADIEKRFKDIIDELGIEFDIKSEIDIIAKQVDICPDKEYLASRGEYLNSKILAAYLGYKFIDAYDVIFFDEKGNLEREKTYTCFYQKVKDYERAVIPGFYGQGFDGRLRTFSRGGSDVTGAIAARAMSADIYENWTDVSGMKMADPRHIDNPETIPLLSYVELRELAYMGATVLHDEAVFPVRKAGIPINIRNTNRPMDDGTMIVEKAPAKESKHIITGLAGKCGFMSITLEKDMMNAEVGFARKVLSILENKGVSLEHLPTGIDTMSMIIPESEVDDLTLDEIITEIRSEVAPDFIMVDRGLALIAVVGRRMVFEHGVAARMFSAIASKGVNVKMIDQGSSGLNVIIGVRENDYHKALVAIYNEFVK